MQHNMTPTLFTITLLLLLLFILPLSSSSSSSSTEKAVSDASGKACTYIVLSDRTIPYNLCFNTLTKSRSADLKSLSQVAVTQAHHHTKTILDKLKQLKEDAYDVEDEEKVNKYRTCLRQYNHLDEYVSSAWHIITGKTYGDAKTDLRNAITAARISANECEKQFKTVAGWQSSISAVGKTVETLVKITVKILDMIH